MSSNDLLSAVAEATAGSSVIREITGIKERAADGSLLFADDSLRELTPDEIGILEANLNSCDDWSRIRVVNGFDPDRVRGSSLSGRIVLGRFTGEAVLEPGFTVPTGISGSRVSDCEIGDEAAVVDVHLLGKMIVKAGAVLFNCGSVVCTDETTFGNGVELPIALETGGREVRTYAEITIEIAAGVASSRDDDGLIGEYERLVEAYLERCRGGYGVIGAGARLSGTARVENVFMDDGCAIRDAGLVKNATLLGSQEEPSVITSGAIVTDSILQWGSEAASGAIVDRAVLTEHSHVERHGKVTDSLLGPNTGVGEGEVTSCLVGPFVGFHHQALLIAAYWPEGKGNVGYGANVGSNHTSKAPDQEIWCGEGTFFGLGVNIKFPADFTGAPYSIIATAVNTLPQKVTFPFSLINAPSAVNPGLSPAYNEILPGWVLSDNIYSIRRNEEKYLRRNRATRSRFDFEVFRPDIMDLVLGARDALRSMTDEKEYWTDRDIPGLGKNYLSGKNRQKAIATYTFFLRDYALAGLRREVTGLIESGAGVDRVKLLEGEAGSRWAHEREILLAEGLGDDLESNLRAHLENQQEIARMVQASKEKDDIRGARIIPDYPAAHLPAAEDDFVLRTWQEYEMLKAAIEKIIPHLD